MSSDLSTAFDLEKMATTPGNVLIQREIKEILQVLGFTFLAKGGRELVQGCWKHPWENQQLNPGQAIALIQQFCLEYDRDPVEVALTLQTEKNEAALIQERGTGEVAFDVAPDGMDTVLARLFRYFDESHQQIGQEYGFALVSNLLENLNRGMAAAANSPAMGDYLDNAFAQRTNQLTAGAKKNGRHLTLKQYLMSGSGQELSGSTHHKALPATSTGTSPKPESTATNKDFVSGKPLPVSN